MSYSTLFNIILTWLTIANAACHSHVDVAIVGAGLSGLSAARELKASNKSIIILEARDRVGGRVENKELSDGGVVELGAAFVGPTQDKVLQLAADLRLETFLEYNTGNNVLFAGGSKSLYSSSAEVPPSLDAASLQQIAEASVKIDTMASEIDVNAPWSHPNAAAWDAETFDSFLKRNVPLPTARFLFEASITSVFAATPSELSLLYVIAYIAAAANETTKGTFERLVGTADGAQERRIVGGTGLLATGMAYDLGSDNIILNAPVDSITEDPSGYVVDADGCRVTATHIVVAMSPPLAARITYKPELPAMRDQLTQRMYMGSLGKAIAVYETPFWRAANLTGQAVGDTGTARITFDDSPKDASTGILLGFLLADESRLIENASDAAVVDLVKEDFVNYFGSEAANVKQWVVVRWDTEIFSRGGPTALAGPGTLTKYGSALRAPFKRIHWAGTETSEYWTGYMEGAVRSGERVAKEILVAL